MSLTRNFGRNQLAALTYDPFAWTRQLFEAVPAARGSEDFVPRFDIKETPDSFVLHADVPGIKQEDLDITVHGGVVTVKGSRSTAEKKDTESWHISERYFGSFERRFSLPETADSEKVEASLDSGVLTVSIGKKTQAQPRKVPFKQA